MYTPGSKVMFKVDRAGKKIDILVTIGSKEEYKEKIGVGIKVKAMSKEDTVKFGLSKPRGVIITDVNPESDAAKKKIRPGIGLHVAVLKDARRPKWYADFLVRYDVRLNFRCVQFFINNDVQRLFYRQPLSI